MFVAISLDNLWIIGAICCLNLVLGFYAGLGRKVMWLVPGIWILFWLAVPHRPHTSQVDLDMAMAAVEEATKQERLFSHEDIDFFTSEAQGNSIKFASPSLETAFDKLSLEPYIAVTFMSLSFEPLIWKGRPYSWRPEYDQSNPEWLTINGSAVFRRVLPIPNETVTQAYLVVEATLISEQSGRLKDTYLGSLKPEISEGQVLIDPTLLADAQNPFSMKIVALDQVMTRHQMAGFFLALALIMGLFKATARTSNKRALLMVVALFVTLALSPGYGLSQLSIFNTSIIGSPIFANLLASPFHYAQSIALTFLLLRLLVMTIKQHRWAVVLFVTLLMFALLSLDPFLVSIMTTSPVHPLELFDSPGAGLTLATFYFMHALIVWLLRTASSGLVLLERMVLSAFLLTIAMLAFPGQLFTATAFALLWLVVGIQRMRAIRQLSLAALSCALFYPGVFLSEQTSELHRIQTEMMDDVTLLSERNHARMSLFRRSVQKIEDDYPTFVDCAEWLAGESGFTASGVAYGIRLVGVDGQILSENEYRVNLDRIPALLGPENRIEFYQESSRSPLWMFYRTHILLNEREVDIIAVLGNDYHTLSFGRDHKDLTSQHGHRYFAFDLQAYDRAGFPLSRYSVSPLTPEDFNALESRPYVWTRQGRHTSLLFSDEHYLYRIVHTKTPLKMVITRWLLISLAIWTVLQLLRMSASRRHPLIKTWQRSFAFKFAVTVFMGSIIPTASLGWLLFSSIQKNQAREQRDAVQARMGELVGFLETLVAMEEQYANRDQRQPRTIMELATRLDEENVSFYPMGSLSATNRPELFQRGGLDARLPYSMARDLMQRKSGIEFRSSQIESQHVDEVLTLLPFPTRKPLLVGLADYPNSRKQSLRWQEQVELTLATIFVLLYIMAYVAVVVARRSLRPVKAITRGATRLSRGLSQKPIAIDRHDELSRMVDAFNRMQEKINWSQREVARQLGLFNVTIQSMNSGLLGCDAQKKILLSNARSAEILGFDQHAIPESLSSLVEQCEGAAALIDLADNGQDEERHIDLGKREILVTVRTREASFKGDVTTIFVIDDITHVLAANRLHAWSEMARRVAHEIKNPLTPIQLEVDHIMHLHQIDHAEFAKELGASADIIRQQVSHLRQIAVEFSDYARPFILEKQPMTVAALIDEIIGSYQRTLPELHFELELNRDITLSMDRRLMRRALHNLIENAVQAMDQQGTITITVAKVEQEIVIAIKDDGPGIALQDQTKVFDAYFSTKDRGTGLGLAIAKRTIEEHGGLIAMDSECKQGARVIIKLPCD